MTLACPHCGGSIPAQIWAQRAMQILAQQAQPGSNQEIEHGSDSDLDVGSTPTAKAYNKDYNAQFLVFWAAYPLKRSKRKAQIAWRKAVKRMGGNRDSAMAQIVAGAMRYRDDPNRLDEFTKYAEGWLNGDGWEDEPLPARTNGKVDKADLILRRVREVERGRHDSGSPYRQAPGSLSAG